jgi:Uncharacterized conserved protein
MSLDFEKFAMKGNEFVNVLATRLGDAKDRDRAARILRSVFHSLRNHLSLTESFQMMAQLPMAIKSVYVDGWKVNAETERIHSFDDMVNEIIKAEGNSAWRDFSSRDDVINGIRAVVQTMACYVSKNELEDAFSGLPKGLKKIFIGWVYE